MKIGPSQKTVNNHVSIINDKHHKYYVSSRHMHIYE